MDLSHIGPIQKNQGASGAVRSRNHVQCIYLLPYRITNISSLLPITVMVLLFVNTAATMCYSLCLLGSSGDWAVNVVCDDGRKLFGIFHHWPEFDTWLINSFARTSYVYFFEDHNRTTLGLIGNSLCEVLWNQVQYCDDAVYQYIAMICHLFRPIFTWQTIIH